MSKRFWISSERSRAALLTNTDRLPRKYKKERKFKYTYRSISVHRELVIVRRYITTAASKKMFIKFKAGIPVEFLAIAHDMEVEQVKAILKIAERLSLNSVRVPNLNDQWWDSVVFFREINTPVHIMARIYYMSFDDMLSLLASYRYKYHLNKVIQQAIINTAPYAWKTYLDTEAGKARMEQVKRILKWR